MSGTRVLRLGACAAFCFALLTHAASCGREGSRPAADAPETAENRKPAAMPAAQDRYDLQRDEERGGHTLKKHVGRSDEELRDRLRRERSISAASTWTNREAAEETVAAALRAEQRRVERWISRGYPRANLALYFDAGHPVGRSLDRGADRAVDCTRAVIVLRADGPEGFYVLTAYPEAHE